MAIKVNKQADRYTQTHTIGVENKDGVVVAWVNVAVHKKANQPIMDEETLISALESKGLTLRVTSAEEVEFTQANAEL